MPRALQGIAALGWLVFLGFLIAQTDTAASGWWLALLLGSAWAAAPYALLLRVGRRLGRTPAARASLLAGVAVLAGGGALLLWHAFVVALDPQSALVFLFLPFWQGVASVLVLAVAARLSRGT